MSVLLIRGDARNIPLADKSIHCCVSSPPYWGLRDYGVAGQLGLEKTPEEYIRTMVDVFREVKRVLRDDGTLWLNMGDSYQGGNRGEYGKPRGSNGIQKTNPGSDTIGAPNRFPIDGLKPKDLVGVPWMLAFALRADGWYLRSDIIWSKQNPMPESVTDRPTKAHEYIFLLSKNQRYYYDAEAIMESVTGEAHARGDGVNPKAKAFPAPTGWDTSTTDGGHGKIHKQGRNNQPNGKSRFMAPRMTTDNRRCPKDISRDEQGLRPGDRFGRGPGWRKKNDEGNRRYVGFNERWDQREASRSRQNESFSAVVNGLVEKRNKRTVWTVNPQPFPEAHFATFPEDLIKPCILAGCPAGGTVLDPFMGSGTTALVARNLQCNAVGLELNMEYLEIAKRRLSQSVLDFVGG